MPKSTLVSKSSRTRLLFELLAATALAAGVCLAALWHVSMRGLLLHSNDAAAHANIARRLWDSRTPDYEQIGTVWLPLPHWIMEPFTRYDDWWRSGLAGGLPAAIACALAAVLVFLAVRRMFSSSGAAWAALLLFLMNPNLLYTGATPMTEPFQMAALAGVLYFTLLARDSQSVAASAAAGLFACAGTLVRYESWFLIPFVSLYLLFACGKRRWTCAIAFGAVASAGPVYWILHNWYVYGDPWEFYRGPYSPKGIYQRALDAGMARYPGDHDLAKAWQYFAEASRMNAGTTLLLLAGLGTAACLMRRVFWPLALLSLPCLFYVLSRYSSGTPIFLPHLWPYSYYNARYGLAALPLLAIAASGLAAVGPARWRAAAALLVPLAAASPWILNPSPERWVCWKEAQINSEARRSWTSQAADYLRQNYKGGGILTSFGDLMGIYQQAGIPLRETIHEGNNVEWSAPVARPALFLRQEWVVAMAGDRVARAVVNAQRKGPFYDRVKMVVVKGAPVIEIYRRGSQIRPPDEPAEEEPGQKP